MQIKTLKSGFWISLACLSLSVFLSTACKVPNLEESECTEARVFVKQFYSFHFDGEMQFSSENLKKREKFLSESFRQSLADKQTENDVFTINSTDFPKAFRLGKCQKLDPNRTRFEVILFWKTDDRAEEKTIEVESIKQGNTWLIDKILQP